MADTAPNAAPPALTMQSPFGPFVLLRRLGTGGMAETYLAERRAVLSAGALKSTEVTLKVCLKLILPEHAQDRAFVGWFFDEASIHAQLHHEHIVQVYDFGEQEGRYYLALEYVEGCELRKLMHLLADAKRRLPYRLALALTHELGDALECAHRLAIDGVQQGLVHRDISPHNILLSMRGHAKLADFGIAKAQRRITRTDTGLTKGKLPYMSPEQISAPKTVDGRSDLFALGVILFELLSGQHPFRTSAHESELELARRVLAGERPRLRDLAPDVPREICDMVEQLLATDPNLRVPSAAALVRWLEREPHAPRVSAAREIAEYVTTVGTGTLPASALPWFERRAGDTPKVPAQARTSAFPPARPSAFPPDTTTQSRVVQQHPASPPRPRRKLALWSGAGGAALGAALVFLALRSLQGAPAPVSLAFEPAARTPAAESPSAAPATVVTAPPGGAGSVLSKSEAASPDRPPSSASAPADPIEETEEPAGEERPSPEAARVPIILSVPEPVPAKRGVAASALTKPVRVPGDNTKLLRVPGDNSASSARSDRAPDGGLRGAWLDVVVDSDGQVWRVWVDGQYQGSADVKVKVDPGKHTVAVGVERPTVERAVRVAAETTRGVHFSP